MKPQTATNAETGDKAVLIEGSWYPYTQSATDRFGSRAFLVDNNWVEFEHDPASLDGDGWSLKLPEQKQVSRIPGAASVRDNLSNLANSGSLIPGPADDIVGGLPRVLLRTGAGIADTAARPVNATTEGWDRYVSSPGRTVRGTGEAIHHARKGEFEEAGQAAMSAALSGGEFVLGTVSGGTAARSIGAAKPVPRPMTAAEGAFERTGVPEFGPAITDSRAARGMAKSISENVVSGGEIRRGARRSLQATEAGVEKVADNLGGATPRETGRLVLGGVEMVDRQAGKYYAQADDLIDYDAPVAPTVTLNRLGEERNLFSNSRLQAMFEPKVVAELESIFSESNAVSVGDLRRARTLIRERQKQPDATKTQDDFALERLESALTEDIYEGVRETAGPRALTLLKRADQHYRGTKERLRTVLRPYTRNGRQPEEAFRNLMSAMQQTGARSGRGDLKELRAIRKGLSAEERRQVAGGVLKAAMRQKEGDQFSLNAFVENWRNMGPTQKNIIFGSSENMVRRHIDDLVTVASRLKDVEDMANFSRSGVSIQNMATLSGFASAPLTTTSVMLAQGSVGHLLTNPAYLRIARNTANLEYQAARLRAAGNQVRAEAVENTARVKAIAAMEALAEADEMLSSDIAAIIESMGPVNENEPTSQTGFGTP